MDTDGYLDGDEPSGGLSGFAFGITFSISIFALLVVITIAWYLFSRRRIQEQVDSLYRRNSQENGVEGGSREPVGLDEAALSVYPMLLYSKAKQHRGEGEAAVDSCCSICLGEYREKDMVRLLPHCGHLFHQNCIDPWLRLHPSCPMCRKTPAPVATDDHADRTAPEAAAGEEQV